MAPRRSFYSRTFLFLVLLGTDSVLSMPNLQKRWVLSELKADTFSSVPVSTVTQVPIASETTAPGTTGVSNAGVEL